MAAFYSSAVCHSHLLVPMKTSIPVVSAIALLSLSIPVFAEAPAYKADHSFGNEDMKSAPICVSIDSQDQLYVLLGNGTVLQYDTEGNKTGGFKADLQRPTTMTVTDGKIYLFTNLTEEKEMEFRGKKVKRLIPAGVGCSVYDPAGAKLGEVKLPEVVSARDAHFIGKELAVGDLRQGQIVFFELDGAEGKVTRKITKGFRLCCGIFDFCPGSEPDTLVAANLGAFKVQAFKGAAKTSEFGQRGAEVQEFHGCCNPVNVASLADGLVVTVEKSPTRVKIFDKEHKSCSVVSGLTELVKGCSTIPVAVDSKGTLYLASGTKRCIVKCVPAAGPSPAE